MAEVLGSGSRKILVLPDGGGSGSAMLRSYAGRLVDEGFRVAIVGAWEGADDLEIPDRLGLNAARKGREVLGGGAIGILGFGVGGLFGRLAAAALPGFTAVIDFGGRLVYPTITPQKPAQPMDLLPGMSAALQYHAPLHAPPLEHQQELQRRMEHSSLPFQLFRYEAEAGFYDPLATTYDADAAELAWTRAIRFLEHLE